MATLREVKKRIRSAQNIKQITKAMKMVAAAKLRKSQDRIFSARPYAEKINEVIAELSHGADGEKFPLVRENAGVEKEGVILVSADKGLCGSYNTNLVKETMSIIKEKKDLAMYYIGKKGMDLLKKFGRETEAFKFNDKSIGWGDVEEIGSSVIDSYVKGKFGKVNIIYSMFQSSLQQKIVKKQLLPVSLEGIRGEEAGPARDFIYEPGAEAVLNNLLTRYVKISIYRAVLEAQASEHGVRMVAMEMATNNANDMINDLTLLANKTRQTVITTELNEIVGGAEAIKG